MANRLNLFRNGAVGFIDWLGVAGCRGKVWSQPCAVRKVTTLPPPADSYDYRQRDLFWKLLTMNHAMRTLVYLLCNEPKETAGQQAEQRWNYRNKNPPKIVKQKC
jgi:hypothetical protein